MGRNFSCCSFRESVVAVLKGKEEKMIHLIKVKIYMLLLLLALNRLLLISTE